MGGFISGIVKFVGSFGFAGRGKDNTLKAREILKVGN